MLRLFAFCVLTLPLVMMMPGSAHAAEIKAESQITAATVYADRAMVTRTATVDIPAGAHEITFSSLPIRLLPDSLRVEGKGTNSVIFGALSHKIVNAVDLVVPREKELSTQIRALQDKKLVMNAETDALKQQEEFYKQLMKDSAERSREEIADFNLKPDQWKNAADTIMTGITEIKKALVAQTIAARQVDEDISKLQRDLAQLRTGSSKRSYDITLPVESGSAGRITIELSYQMPNATWRPVYDARLDTRENSLEIVQYGTVTQRTGEDWNNIKLTLSTARPQRGASLPPLEPMWVNLAAPMQKHVRSRIMSAPASRVAGQNLAAMESMAFADAAMDEPMMDKEAVMRTAQIDTGGFTAEYVIPGPSDVPADGTDSKLLIGAFETSHELQTYVKPQLSEDAFLVAQMLLKGDSPILPGAASLFLDGGFIGQSVLPLLRPGKDHNLYFGIDDQIDVKRETLMAESGEEGILGRDNVKEQRYVTKIHNLRSMPVKLVVTEAIPVPQDEKIELRILKNETTAGYEEDINDKKGVIQWVKDLPAGEETAINLGWKLSWPKDSNITGLY